MLNVIERHLDDRQSFHKLANQTRDVHAKNMEQLHCDIADFMRMVVGERPNLLEQFNEASKQSRIASKRLPKDNEPTRGR